MKSTLRALSSGYLYALRKHLRQSSGGSLEPARRLGCKAAAAGLQRVDMVRIHEGAVASLKAEKRTDGLIQRADAFSMETIAAIEEAHSATRKCGGRLSELNEALGRRATDMTAYNRSLKQGIARREIVEATLRRRVEHYKRALKESLPLQKRLERLTYRLLSAQENNRRKISHDLQNDVAQTLLAINVRLLTVEKAAGLNGKSLQKEIAGTLRLVDRSVKTIKRFALEYGKHQEP